MKTKEELNALKNEVEALKKKLAELNEDELKQVVSGRGQYMSMTCSCCKRTFNADISMMTVICPHCGMTHYLFG